MVSAEHTPHISLDTEALKKFPPDGCDHYAWLHYVLPLVEQVETLRELNSHVIRERDEWEATASAEAQGLSEWFEEATRLKEQYEGALATIEILQDKEVLSDLIASQGEELSGLKEQLAAVTEERRLAGTRIRELQEQYETAIRHFDYVGGLVNAALDYRSCGRFDVTPCRERPEMMPPDWCAWCALTDAVSSSATESAVASGADTSGPSGEPGADSVPFRESS